MWPTQVSRRPSRSVFDSPFSVLSEDMSRALTDWWREAPDRSLTGVYPVDIREDNDHIFVDAELPGFKPEEVNVTLENGLLHIQAERTIEEKDGEHHLRERRFARVARSFSLPNTVNENKVDAKMENGVLHLTLNKREEVKPRKIEVK